MTAFAPPHIEITFDGEAAKTFVYPQAVGRFIRFTGEAAQQQAQRDREQAEALARESAMAKLLADRRKAEEAARQPRI